MDKEFVQSLNNGLKVLECFNAEHKKINIAIVSRLTGLTRAAARRYLYTLEKLGYIEKSINFYYLKPRVLMHANAYYSTAIMPKIAQPILNALTLQHELAFSISILDNHEVITVCRSSNYNYVIRNNPYGMHLGSRLPVHATSSGKILLALSSEEETKQILDKNNLIKLTPYTKTSREDLTFELQEIARKEWCYSAQEHELGIHALAVPIYDNTNKVIAALNIVSPMNETSKDYLVDCVLPKLLTAAYDIRKLIC